MRKTDASGAWDETKQCEITVGLIAPIAHNNEYGKVTWHSNTQMKYVYICIVYMYKIRTLPAALQLYETRRRESSWRMRLFSESFLLVALNCNLEWIHVRFRRHFLYLFFFSFIFAHENGNRWSHWGGNCSILWVKNTHLIHEWRIYWCFRFCGDFHSHQRFQFAAEK